MSSRETTILVVYMDILLTTPKPTSIPTVLCHILFPCSPGSRSLSGPVLAGWVRYLPKSLEYFLLLFLTLLYQ